jgi:hypothetical protein
MVLAAHLSKRTLWWVRGKGDSARLIVLNTATVAVLRQHRRAASIGERLSDKQKAPHLQGFREWSQGGSNP